MAIVARKLADQSVCYWVATSWRGRVYYERSGKDKREAERLNTRRKQEKRLGTYEPSRLPLTTTIAQFTGTFFERRRTRSVDEERKIFARHILSRDWLASLPLADTRPKHAARLVRELRSAELSDKTIANVLSPLRLLFSEAILEDLVNHQPIVLQANTLDRDRQVVAEIYQPAEVVALTRNANVDWPSRVLLALLFFTGMRLGEAAGRRWRDLRQDVPGLPSLHVQSQYGGRKTKTNTTRVVPVHPELGRILEAWVAEGFELWTGSPPAPDDYLVPNMSRRRVAVHHTKKTVLRLMHRACDAVAIHHHARAVHATRNTFITMIRRAGAEEKHVEKITHNAKGTMVDQYTQLDWAPLCKAMLCLDYDARLELHRIPGTSGPSGGILAPNTNPNSESLLTTCAIVSGFDSRRLHQKPPRRLAKCEKRSSAASKNPRALTPSQWALADAYARVTAGGAL